MLCPVHPERTPLFFIYTRKNAYRFFGCGTAGEPISLVSIVHRSINWSDDKGELTEDEFMRYFEDRHKEQFGKSQEILDYLHDKANIEMNLSEAPENLLNRLLEIETRCTDFGDRHGP